MAVLAPAAALGEYFDRSDPGLTILSQCSYINESKLYEYLSSPLHFNCLCCH